MPIHLTPVYDVANHGHDLFLPITDVLALTSVTISTSLVTKSTNGGNFPINDFPYVISNVDAVGLASEGNNTIFSRIYTWIPDRNMRVSKVSINLAASLNISTYSSGTFNVGNLRVITSQREPFVPLFNTLLKSTAANQTATGNSYHIYADDITGAFNVRAGIPIDFDLAMVTTTGTGTRQEGILPVFPYQLLAVTKIFSLSGFLLRLDDSVDSNDQMFSDQMSRLKQ